MSRPYVLVNTTTEAVSPAWFFSLFFCFSFLSDVGVFVFCFLWGFLGFFLGGGFFFTVPPTTLSRNEVFLVRREVPPVNCFHSFRKYVAELD